MKRTLLSILLVIVGFATTRAEAWQWVIEGKAAGSNILFAPQQFIENEHNFSNLFVGGNEGERVVAPTDGTVLNFGFCHFATLTNMMSFDIDDNRSIEEQYAEFVAQSPENAMSQYITGSISLLLDDGRRIYLSGFMPARYFKSGERIARGTHLGSLHYSYRNIRQPSLCISVTTKMGSADDPMTPFGLKTTFVAPESAKHKEFLTSAEATEDLQVILNVLREAYPSLHEVVSDDELAAFERDAIDAFRNGIESRWFYFTWLGRLQALVHDSHLYLYPPQNGKPSGRMPQIVYGWFDDRYIVTMTDRQLSEYVGRAIKSVDGIDADSLHRLTIERQGRYDLNVKSHIDEQLALFGTLGLDESGRQLIEFDDGEVRQFEGIRSTGRAEDFTQSYMGYLVANRHAPDGYKTEIINDSTAYIGLTTFSLTETATDAVIDFIATIAENEIPNLIVDLRNNAGGEATVLRKILSCILNEPSRNRGAMHVVNKRGKFSSFKDCCLNYNEQMMIFEDFEPMADGLGYYNTADCQPITPNLEVQYRGRVYVLTNGSSCSAATIFPAEIVRNHRGVVVGRETQTAYHFMTAHKFADIRLPNSGFQFRVPLVKVIYDTTQNERVPYGRGVLPDYPVELSRREIFEQPDLILDYALQLIDDGRYFVGDDPFATADSQTTKSRWWIWALAAAALIAAMFGLRRRAR